MLHARHSIAAPLHHSRRLLAALLLGAGLAACGDPTAPERGPLTAEWVAPATGTGALTGIPMSLELQQAGAAVTGTGTAVLPSGTAVALVASGEVSGRVVTLELDSAPAGGFPAPLLLQAMLSEDGERLSGAITQGQLTEVRIFQRTGR